LVIVVLEEDSRVGMDQLQEARNLRVTVENHALIMRNQALIVL
jgi:hypothetical protein